MFIAEYIVLATKNTYVGATGRSRTSESSCS